jgi:hypothetical protein
MQENLQNKSTQNSIFINLITEYLLYNPVYFRSWDSSVGITRGWEAGVQFLEGARNFSLFYSIQIGSGTTQPLM